MNKKFKFGIFLWVTLLAIIMISLFAMFYLDLHIFLLCYFISGFLLHFFYPVFYYYYTGNLKIARIWFFCFFIGSLPEAAALYDVIIIKSKMDPIALFEKLHIMTTIPYLISNILTNLVLIITLINMMLLIISSFERIGLIPEELVKFDFLKKTFSIFFCIVTVKLVSNYEKYCSLFSKSAQKYIWILNFSFAFLLPYILVFFGKGIRVNSLSVVFFLVIYLLSDRYIKFLENLSVENVDNAIKTLESFAEFIYKFYQPEKITFNQFLYYILLPKLDKISSFCNFLLLRYQYPGFKIVSITHDSENTSSFTIVYDLDEKNKNFKIHFNNDKVKELRSSSVFGLLICMGIIVFYLFDTFWDFLLHFYFFPY